MKFDAHSKKKEMLAEVIKMAKKHRVTSMHRKAHAPPAHTELASEEPLAGEGNQTEGLAHRGPPTPPETEPGMDPEVLKRLLDTMGGE